MDYILRNLHFIFIHFPIALLFMSLLFDLAAILFKRNDLHAAGLITLVAGTLGAIASVITGPEEERNPLFHQHELFGQLTMIWFIAVTVIRLGLLWYKKWEAGKKPVYLIAALIGLLLVTYSGHLGGQMVHKDRSKIQKPVDANDQRSFPKSDSLNRP